MHSHVFKSTFPSSTQPRTTAQDDRRSGAIQRWFRTAFRAWERRKMIGTLRSMDDHLLRDIGIDRSDIPRVVDGFTDRELGMRPVSSDEKRGARGHVRRVA